MRNKTIHIILFFVLYSSFLFAQKLELKGFVKDSLSQQALSFSTVAVSADNGTIADSNGFFSLQLSPGKYIVTASYLGHVSQQKIIVLQENMEQNFFLAPDVSVNDVIVVSVSKRAEKQSSATVSIDVVKPKLIDNTTANNLSSVLEQSPGITIISGQANIRAGSGFSYGAGSRVLTLVDDMPLLTAGSNDVKWDLLPTENVKQIEVIKGSASALYGSSALNGVVNVITDNPTEKGKTYVRFLSGIYDNPLYKKSAYWQGVNPFYSGVAFSHGKKIKSFQYTFTANGFKDQGYNQGEYKQKARSSLKLNYSPNVFKKRLNIGLSATAQYTEIGQFIIWNDDTTGILKAVNGETGILAWGQYTLDPSLTYQWSENHKSLYRGRYFIVGQAALYYQELQHQSAFDITKKTQLAFTAGLVQNHVNVNTEEYGIHQSNNYSGYVQGELNSGRLKSSVGLRYESFSQDTFATQKVPLLRAGLSYRVHKSSYFRASYGQGYRYPSMAESFIQYDLGKLRFYSNPNLKSEYGETAEIGFKQDIKFKKWKGYVDVAAYTARYYNMIQFSVDSILIAFPDVQNTVVGFRAFNVSEARINGIEASVAGEGKIGAVGVFTLLGYNYSNPVDVSYNTDTVNYKKGDEILKYRFEHTAKANLIVEYRSLSVGVFSRYNSFIRNIDPIFESSILGVEMVQGLKHFRQTHNKGDILLDVNLSHQLNKSVQLSFMVKNVFNRLYSIQPAKIEPGRSFTFQVTGIF